MAFIGLVTNGLYFFLGERVIPFNSSIVANYTCRLILILIGVRVKIKNSPPFQDRQCVFMFNHNSYLDAFVTPTLCLPNMRYTLSIGMKRIKSFYFGTKRTGAIFIPMKKDRDKRVNFFKNLEKRMRQEKFNLLVAPEGVHYFKHQIAPFNKGVFHLAKSMDLPICPVYFHIPKETNPYQGYFFKRGTIEIEFLAPIETKDWQLSDLTEEKEKVRQVFVHQFEQSHQEKIHTHA
jgi:1-acyl-sn-glycerol-3-phosphate acyltransferase